VPRARFERATPNFVGWCSVQLSYRGGFHHPKVFAVLRVWQFAQITSQLAISFKMLDHEKAPRTMLLMSLNFALRTWSNWRTSRAALPAVHARAVLKVLNKSVAIFALDPDVARSGFVYTALPDPYVVVSHHTSTQLPGHSEVTWLVLCADDWI
jgi:hypothetical protein